MNRLLAMLGVAALGAGAMFYLDPDNGRRRRAQVGDRACSMTNDARDYLDKQAKRGTDQLQGMMSRIRGRLTSPPPSDQQLQGQIRSHLGRVVSYPRAVETDVQQGRVILRGDVLADEFNLLMAELWSLPGVTAVDSQLALHTESALVPAFAGKPRRITKARLRSLGRGITSAAAVAGGIGSLVRALRIPGAAPRLGLISLAATLMAYGVGGNVRRLMAPASQLGPAHRTETSVAPAPTYPSELSPTETGAAPPAPSTALH